MLFRDRGWPVADRAHVGRVTVRVVVGSLVALTAASMAPSALAAQHPTAHGGFRVPDAAITRSLGAIPRQSTVPQPKYLIPLNSPFPGVLLPGNDTLTASQERGVSLGGIGAGSFEVNQAGSFGPWNFGNGTNEWRNLPQAAFHVYESAGASSTTRTLAVNGTGPFTNAFANQPTDRPAYPSWSPGVDAAWPTLSPGDATYRAMYPFAWISYKDAAHGGPFQADIATRFWSPLVPGDDQRSSMPVAYFDVRLANHTRRPLTESVMFTFPNAPAHVADAGPISWIGGQGIIDTSIVGTAHSTRTGFTSRFDSDRGSGIAGLTLGAGDSSNTPDTQNSDWTIAARPARGQRLSYTSSWNGAGDGTDILNAFKTRGALPNEPLDQSNTAGAIAVQVTLRPGQSTVIPFILAWDFPQTVYTAGTGSAATTTVWMRRYTSYFGARQDALNNYVAGSYQPHQGWTIADRLLRQHDANLSAVLGWWAPIAYDPKVSPSLRTAALDQLAYLLTNGFWVSGLVSNDTAPAHGQRLGTAFRDTHLFGVQTGGDGGDQSFMNGDVTVDIALALDDLYPHAERDYLRAIAQALAIQRAQGLAPGLDLGSLLPGSPYVTWNDEPAPGGLGKSLSHAGAYLFRFIAYYNKTHDGGLLDYAYPGMVALYDAEAKAHGLADGDLPVGNGTTYDLLPVDGHGALPSAIWLVDLESMIAATEAEQARGQNQDLATSAFLAALQSRFTAAKTAFETSLWNAKFGHYNFDTGSSLVYDQGVFAAATLEQERAVAAGLPPFLDADRVEQHLQTVYDDLFAPFTDLASGRHIGAINLVSNTTDAMPHGGVFGSLNPVFFASDASAREIWTGTNYRLAAQMIDLGRTRGNRALVREGRRIAAAVARETNTTGYAFQTPEAQGILDNPPSDDDNPTPAPIDPTTAVLKPDQHRNLSYSRPLAVWDALAAEDARVIPEPDR
jgi:non-lysosomal glucosylceramidase